jgi:hypothetical protein
MNAQAGLETGCLAVGTVNQTDEIVRHPCVSFHAAAQAPDSKRKMLPQWA